MRSVGNNKKINNKKKKLNVLTLKKSAYVNEFEYFYSLVKQLEAEGEIIEGKRREYVYTWQLYRLYKTAFKNNALVEGAVRYRLQQLDMNNYPNDFIALKDTLREKDLKYVVNRLNKNLLIQIYLPFEKEDRIDSLFKTGTFKDFYLDTLEPPEITDYTEGENFDDDF